MATRRYSIAVGGTEFSTVTEAAGAATVTNEIELTVDLATSIVNTTSGTRKIKKEELLQALVYLENHILKNTSGVLG